MDLNAEEDQDELDRRFAATCQHYEIKEADLGGRLFVQSVRDQSLADRDPGQKRPDHRSGHHREDEGLHHQEPDRRLHDRSFISFHAVNENTNTDMDLVIKEGLGAVASATNSAGEIFHHPGKPKPGQETTVDDGRGASAIIWAVRSARVLNFMTPEEAKKIGIAEDVRRTARPHHQRQGKHGAAAAGPTG